MNRPLADFPNQDGQSTSAAVGWPAALSSKAFHGISGRIVKTICPHTEADEAAVLLQVLVAVGNAVGRGPHFVVEADRHSLNLFAVFVGETAKGRKGTSWGHAKFPVIDADPSWEQRIVSGLSSGEGLIWQVRDPIEKQEPVKRQGRVIGYQTVVVDEGVVDKRLMVFEGEFAHVLRVLVREGNTLSAVIRLAWDSGTLRSLTKNSPAVASGAHISIIGHTTREELLRYLDDTEAGNGFGNRFLWICVKRSKVLPEGGNLKRDELTPLLAELKDVIEYAARLKEIRLDAEARHIWYQVYPELSEGKPGLLGAVTARAEAQVMRLACIYAVLDRSEYVTQAHLHAALAIWDYVEASAEYIFGDAFGDPVADTILRTLRDSSNGLTRTGIRDLFGRHVGSDRLDRVIGDLAAKGLTRCETEQTEGRPATRVFAV